MKQDKITIKPGNANLVSVKRYFETEQKSLDMIKTIMINEALDTEHYCKFMDMLPDTAVPSDSGNRYDARFKTRSEISNTFTQSRYAMIAYSSFDATTKTFTRESGRSYIGIVKIDGLVYETKFDNSGYEPIADRYISPYLMSLAHTLDSYGYGAMPKAFYHGWVIYT